MKCARALGSLVVAVCTLTSGALGQSYPNRPITLVVPFAAGGATDAIARILTDPLSHHLGPQILIEDLGGARGMIRSPPLPRAAPPGHTILLHHVRPRAGTDLYPQSSVY